MDRLTNKKNGRSEMETLDVFDELFNPLDPPIATIDKVHNDGLWHQTFACWLVNKKDRSIVWQLRGPRNRIDPGSFDASASGHLSAGENPEHGFRELEEELGVTIEKNKRAYLGVFRNIAIRNSGKYINHEFCHIYLALSDFGLSDFTLQEGEVDAAYEMNIDEGIALLSGKKDTVMLKGLETDKNITVKELCNYHERTVVSNYYLKVLTAARDMLEGRTPLAV